MKLKVKDIKLDEDVYPRIMMKDERITIRMNQKTIDSYVEALKAGAKFPPIEVQKIKEEDEEKIIVLDGLHRLEAYKGYNRLEEFESIEEIEVEFWKEEILNKEKNLNDLRFEAIKQNLIHGDRLLQEDKKTVARLIVEEDVERKYDREFLAEKFCVHVDTISEWQKDIRARQQASKESFIYKLSLLGWTQQEIADMMGMEQPHISEYILKKVNTFSSIISSHKSGKTEEELAEFYELDLPLLWAILLENKSDLERFQLFGKSEYGNDQPKLHDHWNFAKGDLRLGSNYPGRLWCQDVMNILYRYSKKNDLVVDPMAGGATVSDTCLVMGRRCRSFDIKPKEDRKEIVEHDIRKEFSKKAKNCDLIFYDPPYYKKGQDKYPACPEIMENREKFIEFLIISVGNCFDALKKGGCVAAVFGQYIDYENELMGVLGGDLFRIFEEIGFRCVVQIQSPLTFHIQYQAHDIANAKKLKIWKMLPFTREWHIFKKV